MKRKGRQPWLVALLGLQLMWLCLPARPAAAQAAPAALSSLAVALWPEYDRPEMLVIYRGTFVAETAFPLEVELRIPASAGEPSAVAFVNEAGERLNQEYTARAEGEWLVVSFVLSTPGFQLEYYDPLAVDAAGRREYTFDYPADYAVESLSLEVQEPAGAAGFTIEPAAVSRLEQLEGLSYHSIEAGELAEGEGRSWTVAYQKGDTALSLEALPAAPAGAAAPTAAAAGPASGPETGSALWLFAIAFVALAAVGAGAFWLGRQTQAPDRGAEPGRERGAEAAAARRGPPRSTSQGGGQRGALFCHQCGSELRADADFCHRCGAAVRK